MSPSFLPTADLDTLKKRAQLHQTLRAFFCARDLLEVDVPVLGLATVTDPFIDSLQVQSSPARFLQTSPEYFLKRLIACYQQNVFYLGRAFRKDEMGRHHRVEFTMLEWYRMGFDDRTLIEEVLALLSHLAPSESHRTASYREVFIKALGVCPHKASFEVLKSIIDETLDLNFEASNKRLCLDILFSHCVEPTLSKGIVVVTDFPVELGALARLQADDSGVMVAKRFEVYWKGIELANGYWELTDAKEQRERFKQDVQQRQRLDLQAVMPDELLLQALDNGLPDCAGVALGVDRLLMCLLAKKDIAQVMPFADG